MNTLIILQLGRYLENRRLVGVTGRMLPVLRHRCRETMPLDAGSRSVWAALPKGSNVTVKTYIHMYMFELCGRRLLFAMNSQSLILYFNVRFLIWIASLRIFDVIFEVLTDLVQSNPSLDKKEVWHIMCIDRVRCSVPISFARESDVRTPKYGNPFRK